MMNDILDLDNQEKVRYVSESSNTSTSDYCTMSPNPSIHGGGAASPSLSPRTAALQSKFSHLNLPASNSPPPLLLQQQQQQQATHFTTLQNVSHVYDNHLPCNNNSNYVHLLSSGGTSLSSGNATIMARQTTADSGFQVKSEYASQLRILEQPAEKFRFRYKSEMHGTHGSLNGVNSKRTPKTFPEVQLENFTGYAVIRCSLFQTDMEKPHSHQLVVRKDDHDICDPHDLHVSPEKGYVAQFQNMGIIHTAKKFIFEELLKKKRSRLTFKQGCNELSTRGEQELRKETEKEAKAMNLNQVRLCFEAFRIEEDQTWTPIAAPVYTHSINNRKSAQTGELRICRLSIATGSVNGGDDLILLVEKVSKKNIKVRFYENDEYDEPVWEAYGKFRESDVHHQYAIVCTTPPYKNKDIDKPVEVFIELVRPTDDERSFPPVSFRYKPRDAIVSRKRRRTCSTATTTLSSGSNSSISMNSSEFPKTVQEQTAGQMQPPVVMMAAQPTKQFQQQQFQQQQQQQFQQQQQQNLQQHHQVTISEEFNKERQLALLNCEDRDQIAGINSDDFGQFLIPEEYSQILYSDSELLRDICSKTPVVKYLEEDGATSSASSTIFKPLLVTGEETQMADSIIQTNNSHLKRIFKLYQEARSSASGVRNKSTHDRLAKQVSEIFLEFSTRNEDFDSIMHEIVARNNVKLGIKLCEVLKFFNLSDLLNTSINSNGESCLHCACLHNKAHFIRPLLLLGCDANIQDHVGNTALHIAVQERNKYCIDSFLNYMSSMPASTKPSINLKLTNDAGLTPLHMAIRSNSMELIDKFLCYDRSAALVCNTKDGNNALHMAVLQQNVPLIKLIMQLRNVDLEIRNTAGRTVIDLTKTLDTAARKEILELLLQQTTTTVATVIIKEEDMASSSSNTEDDEESDEPMLQEPLELVKVKVEVESTDEDTESDMEAKLHTMLSDENNFSKLSKQLAVQGNWRKLAQILKMQHLLCLWSSGEAMLTYVRNNVKSIGYNNFAQALEEVDKEALLLLQNM